MAELSTSHVNNSLKLLAAVAADRDAVYEEISDCIFDTDSDDDYESSSPVYDSFYSQGRSATILQLSNFSASEFQTLWVSIMNLIHPLWNKGRGRTTKYSAKDVFLMVLVTAKNGGTWDFLARIFHIKAPTFERLVTKFVSIFSEPLFDKCVLEPHVHYTMSKLSQSKKLFKNYPCARYAKDVTFQQANRPSGSLEEGKKYDSGKHKVYGYKVEVSVLPIGIAVHCTDHYPGSIADIEIFYKNLDFHDVGLAKSEKKAARDGLDSGPLKQEYPKYWAVLVDKGYQGSQERVRAIHPRRKPRNGALTLEEKATNKDISSDRIIAENWFGRHCTLWTIGSNKWRWSECLYDPFFKFCGALTNRHISLHPLRAGDLQFYRKMKQRQYIIGEEILKKRKRVQEKYRKRRKQRLAVQFCEGDSSDETRSP